MSDTRDTARAATGECDCPGHKLPGIRHIQPCCDRPHVEDLPSDDRSYGNHDEQA